LWAGLTLGGALGALTYLRLGIAALWAAAALVAVLAATTAWAESRG
jgi:uncharacterized membrane protein YoaK (UPF0700 family)